MMQQLLVKLTWALRDLRNEVDFLPGYDIEKERAWLHERINDVEWIVKDIKEGR